jgi:hypothetical protein
MKTDAFPHLYSARVRIHTGCSTYERIKPSLDHEICAGVAGRLLLLVTEHFLIGGLQLRASPHARNQSYSLFRNNAVFKKKKNSHAREQLEGSNGARRQHRA